MVISVSSLTTLSLNFTSSRPATKTLQIHTAPIRMQHFRTQLDAKRLLKQKLFRSFQGTPVRRISNALVKIAPRKFALERRRMNFATNTKIVMSRYTVGLKRRVFHSLDSTRLAGKYSGTRFLWFLGATWSVLIIVSATSESARSTIHSTTQLKLITLKFVNQVT